MVARRLFDDLLAATADPPGVTRVAYGAGEVAAFDLMAAAAAGWGAERRLDAAGNQFLTLPGRDRSRAVMVGSHLDSVPHGGNFDGAAGVILGLALQASLAAEGTRPPFDLSVACLRAEESCWFPHSYVGSKTALGRLEPDVLDGVRRSDTGRTLAEHMRDLGFDPEAVRRGERLIDPAAIVAFVEPHIEQAPKLVAAGVPLGIVTAIRGSFRFRTIRILGEYAHSGAMPRELRRDAGLAGARLVVAADALWDRLTAAGHDVTVTFGEIGTNPAAHGFSKVPGEMHLCLDVRSQSAATLAEAEREVRAIAARVAAEAGVSIDLGPRTGSDPAPMAAAVVDRLEAAAERAGVPAIRMASGAGHDAATFATAGIPSAMLFIRNENGSHNPDEAMVMADVDAALAVLRAFVEDPAPGWARGAAPLDR